MKTKNATTLQSLITYRHPATPKLAEGGPVTRKSRRGGSPLTTLPLRHGFLLVPLALVCFALSPGAQAVTPAPDGGYPGGNTAEGQAALLSRTTGGFNTAVGYLSLRSDTTGQFNTAIGAGTLLANTADENTATGAGALLSNTTGEPNTATGAFALFSNATGNGNTANGYQALTHNTGGGFNTANGLHALLSNTTGNYNTADGFFALANSTGSSNTALGMDAGSNVATASNVICIGALVVGEDVNNTTWIGNIYGTTTVSGTTLPVVVSDSGQLGTASSSRRFKKEIKPMDIASEAILGLNPVTFHYKSDSKDTPQFGLIAEEVAAVNPDLVVHDKDGEIYTVRYDAVNAMLLNEFLKEHKAVQEQGATIAELKKEIAALTAGLQKVSAQLAAANPSDGGLEATKFATGRIRGGGAAPQVVNNP